MATCKKAKVQEKQTHVMLTEPCVIETFTNVRTFETRNLILDEPGCWNSEVRFRKTRVTIEIVEEPQEVLAARLQDIWDTCDNYHHVRPLRDAAESIGYEYPNNYGSKKGKA